ncbi:MAG: hypothetical protein PHO74_03550 [Weeksellaceae bacterium]|nr:hypothetical protein [Weeksellaceae bacterium]
MKHLNLLTLLLAVVLLSCNKDDDTPKADSKLFYAEINYSLAGASVNGTYNIITNSQYSSGINALMLYFPPGIEEDIDEKAGVTLQDYNQLLRFTIMTPAKLGLVEILDGNTYGNEIAFGFEEMELTASSVSVNITEILMYELPETPGLKHVAAYVGSFEGVVNHEYYDDNGVLVVEPHLANGNFEIYNPL